MKEKIKEVLAASKARQEEARRLNVRAGENLFKVFSLTELIAWVMERLAGARRMTEVVDPEAMRLPELDQSLVQKVLRDNPDEVVVLGEPRKVSYSAGNSPKISFADTLREGNRWLQLPNEGVRLPGGRAVEVELSFGWSASFRTADIPKLKIQVREHLNKELWEKFSGSSSDKPEIILPDPSNKASQVPEVREHQYGTCGVSGETLLAFGAVAVKSSRYYSSDPHFEVKWNRSREEAEKTRVTSVEKLAILKKEMVEKAQVEEVRVQAEAVKVEASKLYNEYSNVLVSELRDKLYPACYSYLPTGLEGLRKWIIETEVLVTEVRPAVEAEFEKRNRGEIRQVRVDRRGQCHKPELNGRRIDNREWYQFTPDWFWSDLLGWVEVLGRGSEMFAIYRGEDPLILGKTQQSLEVLSAKVDEAMKAMGSEPSREAKEEFWRKLEALRPKIPTSPQKMWEEDRQSVPVSDKKQESSSGGAFGTQLGDAFAKLGF